MNWYEKSIREVEQNLKTNIEQGLNKNNIEELQTKYGLNELKAKKKKSLFIKFLEQFKDFMIIVLIISAIVSGIVGVMEGEGAIDAFIILIVVIVNAIIGVMQESKAEKSLEALQKMSAHVAKVIRNGILVVLPSKDLVPGDLVVLETGDYVPADVRLVEAINLKSGEAALTGESVPVEKNIETIQKNDVGIGDRFNMVFTSSLITYGRGKGIVVETGMNTEVGKIANILENTVNAETPLQQKLNKLGKVLGITALLICIIIFIIGVFYGKEPIHMFMTAVSLAVAAIPEGLPAVSTIVLAIGVQRMVKRNAIVKTLPSVETLGCATVICSDKTGTLTQNKMTVLKVFYNNYLNEVENLKNIDFTLNKLIYANILCNDTKIAKDNTLTGDPTETALIDFAFKLDVDTATIYSLERTEEIPFDSDRKLMTTVNKIENKYIVFTKGAVDELIKRCNNILINGELKNVIEYKEIIDRNNENMAKEALRVLGFAYKELDHNPTKEEIKSIEQSLTFIGMVGMIDPPREEAKAAVAKCVSAGIKTVMITGDHKITAIAIAKYLGILKDESEATTGSEVEKMSEEELIKNVSKYSVYARVSPEHKVRIVKAWQANGQVVAMTGDGVNDAPALKTADIGLAMGITGTDVAKEAADVILTDDNFATIVTSVEEGRRIYDNILKAIQFLLSSNIGEIVTLFVAILITPLIAKWFGIADISALEPLLPIHILWINLVTDSLPALALSVDPAEKDIMKRKPIKPGKGIFTKGITYRVVYQGIMVGAITILAFMLGLSTTGVDDAMKIKIGQTMAFTVLALSQLVHVYNVRNKSESIFKRGILNNKKLLLANAISAGLVIIILVIPSLANVFNVVDISALPKDKLMEMLILVFTPIIIVEMFKFLQINTVKDEE